MIRWSEILYKTFTKFIVNMFMSKIYCKKHRISLIHNRYINENECKIEIGYCPKCRKNLTEFSDISNVYISNYEWLYEDAIKESDIFGC